MKIQLLEYKTLLLIKYHVNYVQLEYYCLILVNNKKINKCKYYILIL